MRSLSWIGAAATVLAVMTAEPAVAKPRPDLVVRSLEATPAIIGPGGSLSVSDVVANHGVRAAGDSVVEYTLIARRSRLRLGVRGVPALRPHETSRGQRVFSFPATARDRAYRLLACADAGHRVREHSERNNCRVTGRRIVFDSRPPDAPTLGERPEPATNQTTARITFSLRERGVAFECRLDAGAQAACESPFTAPGLAEGGHRFEVRAIDAAGNRGPVATVEWAVDTTPPAAPVIDERPAAVTADDEARFVFHGGEAGLRFRCAVDDAPPSPCESPLQLSGLGDAEHRFSLVALDAAANASEPVQVTWTIVPERASLGDGAWSWFADPRAVRFSGDHRRTYVGWTSQNGDIKVAAYDHDSLIRTTARVGNERRDDHNNPAIQILPDRRVRVYWSFHGGTELWYRTSLAPEDITAWGPLERVGTTTAGEHGYTYPNPVHLSAEGRTYLFWRGGNWNPAFSSQADGEAGWAPAANVVVLDGERPYMKVASNGVDRIAFAYTDGHPAELEDVNIHYAEYRSGPDAGLYTAGGRRIGALGDGPLPTAGDMVSDPPHKTWIHDVALGPDGHPVIVFAGFPTAADHRYLYARWTGEAWDVHEITAAGGSISEDGRQPFYSGGITLDHDSPGTVYLSRLVDGQYEVESWRTPDGGATWAATAITAGSAEKNVRPVSPRGLLPFSSDLGVIWMRGAYPRYLDFQTSIATVLATGGNRAPVAGATFTPPTGPGPLTVALDASTSSDEDGRVVAQHWDFGDGASGDGERVAHNYRDPGTYFPRLTVTDEAGASDVYVGEITIGPWLPVEVSAGPAWTLEDGDVILSGALTGHEQETTYHFEYGVETLDQRTPDQPFVAADHREHSVTARVAGLLPGVTYRYRLVAANETGAATGPERTFTVAAPSGSAYRAAVLTAPDPRGYWRLGEIEGTTAASETGAGAGTYAARGVTLAQPGALSGDPDTAAGFDGTTGEMSATTAPLSVEGTLEGWFDWHDGVALMRDNTTAGGWILAYVASDDLYTRVAGTTYTTGLPVTAFRDGWHHFAVTKSGADVRLYVDAERLPLQRTSGTVGSSTPSSGAWHVMRNGRYADQFTAGRADEVAVYGAALTAADIRRHYDLGRG